MNVNVDVNERAAAAAPACAIAKVLPKAPPADCREEAATGATLPEIIPVHLSYLIKRALLRHASTRALTYGAQL